MKVSKWKVLSIAGALVLGYVVASDAAQIKVSDDTFADLGYWMKVRYVNFDERVEEGEGIDWNTNVFDVVDARLSVEGQISKMLQFYGEFVSNGAYTQGIYETVSRLGLITDRHTDTRLQEGGVNLVFLPELQLRLGKIRIPFTRAQLADEYAFIVPTGPFYDPQGVASLLGSFGMLVGSPSILDYGSYDPFIVTRASDGGAVLHGDIAGGMLRYNIGIFNEATSEEPFEDVAWAVRVEFTPTMLGFKPETTSTAKGWLKDSYLGKKGDILTIGVGYFTQDVGFGLSEELDIDAWTIDAFLEKRFGNVILNLEGAYIYFDDSHFVGTEKEDSYAWYAQGQLLYDGVVGIGKPALFVRYEYSEADFGDDDAEITRWGAGINYYIAGNAARLTVGFDNVSYDEAAEDIVVDLDGTERTLKDNITDWYVQAQIMF